MLVRRRLEKVEREIAALAKRYAPEPGSYKADLAAMTYEQLKLERAKNLKGLKCPIPAKGVGRDNPRLAREYAEWKCRVLDDVWAIRIRIGMRDNRLLYEAALDDEGRRRLDEEYNALTSMILPLKKSIAEWRKLMEKGNLESEA